MEGKSPFEMKRRSVLKALGATAGGGMIVGNAAADPSPREIFKAGIDVMDETDSVEAFEEYILNRGFRTTLHGSETYPFTHTQSGDLNTENKRVEKNDMTIGSNVYTSGGVSYATGNWRVSEDTGDAWNDIEDPGHAPLDVVGIGWEHSDYDIVWDSWDSSEFCWKERATFNNVAWYFNDKNAYINQYNGELCFTGLVSVELEPTNPISERAIIFNYQHTWFAGRITNIAFNAAGILAVGTSPECRKWGGPKQAHAEDF